MTNYIYWKWGKGDTTNIKSSRNTTNKSHKNEDIDENIKTDIIDDINQIKRDIIYDEIVPQYDIPSDKRELASERISGRQLIIQTPINPFLSDCDYLNDLKVQDTHLRPRDSNI